MKRTILILLIASLVPLQVFAQAQRYAFKVVFTLLTGAAASKAVAETTDAYQILQEKDAVLKSLRLQGLTLDEPAVYSLYFSLNNDASKVKWADIINWPDVFTMIQMEGMGESIIPSITYEYRGQKLLNTFVSKEVPAGRRIMIHFYDDDTANDQIWNSILSTKVNFSLSADATMGLSATMLMDAEYVGDGQIKVTDRKNGIGKKPSAKYLLPTANNLPARMKDASALANLAIRASVDGQFQVLKNPVVIDAPDFIASGEFVVPESSDGQWVADGKIYDGQNRQIGTMRLAQVWRPDNSVLGIKRIMGDRRSAIKRMVYWGGISLVLIIVFCMVGFSKNKFNKSEKTEGSP